MRHTGDHLSLLWSPPGAPVSAVLMSLHGTSSTADRQARLSGLEQLTQTASAVVVFPEAIQPIRTGYEWDPGRDVDCEVTLHEAVRGGFPVVLCCEKST